MTLPSSILSLFFFFSVTATLLIPTRSDVSFNTLLFKGKSHSHRGLTAVKHVHKGSNRRLLTECRDNKNCSLVATSLGSNVVDQNVVDQNVAPTTTPTPESYIISRNVTVCSRNASRRCSSISSVQPNSSSPAPTTILLPPPSPSPRRSRPISYASDKHQLWRTKVLIDKIDDQIACGDEKDCSSSVIASSPGSDESATSIHLSLAEVREPRIANASLLTPNSSRTRLPAASNSSASPAPEVPTFLSPPAASNSSASPAPEVPTFLSPTSSLLPSSISTFGGKNRFGKRTVIIVVASAAVVIFTTCIIICCFRYKSSIPLVKFCFTPKNDQDIEAFLKDHGAVSQKRYKFAEVKKITNSLKVKLGQGGFGAVYKGQLPTGIPVAVKLLNASKRNGEEFINEVASISRTSHVNIVSLLGFCLEGRKKALIYEFMANGSLDKFIYNRGTETITSLSWENLYQISIGIARGLEYLHRGCKTRILHFDIKPHNILLDENFCPKISDFGLAKLCPRKESIISMADTRGTMGYVAPEMCNRQFGGVSHKSDVYSYGMMLLEMVGGRKNINAEASQTSEIYFPHLVHKRLALDKDLRPDEVMTMEENEIAKRMTIVGLWCIQTFPNDRPTMSKVVDMLEDNMNSLEMPPKPMFSSPSRPTAESSS